MSFNMFSMNDFSKKYIKPVVEEVKEEVVEQTSLKTFTPLKQEKVKQVRQPRQVRLPREIKKEEPKPTPSFDSIENIKNDFMNHPEKLSFLKEKRDVIKGLGPDDKKNLLMFFKDYAK